MPKKFWIIGVAGLVWNRELLAFTPMKAITGLTQEEQIRLHWFTDEQEMKAQLQELEALGVKAASKGYELSGTAEG